MASYIDSAAIVSTGTALVLYQQTIGVTPDEIGVMSASLTGGIAVGALFGGRLGDRFGRRRVFLATMVTIVLGGVLLTFSEAYPLLLTGVVLVGLGVGADLPVSLATIAESATERNRGRLVVFSNMLWVIGILVAIGLGAIVGGWGRVGGQIMFGHVAVVAAVVLVLRLSIPESRTWTEARDEQARGVRTIRAQKSGLRHLLRAPYLAPLVALTVFYALTNLSANTSGQFTTYIAVNVAGVPVQTISLVSLVSLGLGFLAGLWFMRVVDGAHRMPYFVVGAVLMVCGPLVLAVFGFSLFTMAASLAVGAVGGSFAFEGIMKVWTQESFPTMLRASAQGGIVATARIIAALLALVTPAIVEASPRGLFWGLAAISAIGLAVAYVGFRRHTANQFDIEQRVEDSTVGPGEQPITATS
jgi:inositol transporter-like SP family MFS transporter